MDLLKHIPLNDIPALPGPGKGSHPWYGTDRPQVYDPTKSVYGPADISYELNSHGYRSPEFTESADIRVLSIGCSIVFGEGVREDDLFHEIVVDHLRSELGVPVINWNLGVPGAGNDAISRLLFHALPILQPDLVLVMFSATGRREHISCWNEWFRLVPNLHRENQSREFLDIHDHYTALLSEPDNAVHFFRNYKAIEAALQGRKWLASFWEPATPELFREYLSPEAFVGCMPTPFLDLARDQGHPGPRTHRELAQRHIPKLHTSGIFGTLSSLARERSEHRINV